MQEIFKYTKAYHLENGFVIPELDIVYHTYGKLSPQKDNVIWVCHALTANSDVKEWWPGTIEKGRFLDPEKYFIVCANILGSCYGTTGPLSTNPLTNAPYYNTFPHITIRDVVGVHQILAHHLGIKQVKLLVGSSIGGFQVYEWLMLDKEFAQSACIIASAPKTETWTIAFNESQRMAIEADSSYGEEREDAAQAGLATARSIALLSYRGREAYNATQKEVIEDKTDGFRVASYQRYQGKKLIDRFNAYSYYSLTKMMDSHNIARGRDTLEGLLSSITTRLLLIAISSDLLFPVSAHHDLIPHLSNAELHVIDSIYGHDGFLVENIKLNKIITDFFDK